MRTAETKTVTHASIRSRLWTLSSSAACWDPVRCGAANLNDGLQKGPRSATDLFVTHAIVRSRRGLGFLRKSCLFSRGSYLY